MSTIRYRMFYRILSMQSNLFQIHVFLVSVLKATPDHTSLKYRCHDKESNEIRVVYLMHCRFEKNVDVEFQ
jgi:hypothetical protein